MLTEPRKIKGNRVVRQYVATGPEDEGSTMNDGPPMSPMRYNLGRDLAILELRHPQSKYHGVAFCFDALFPGQDGDIYTYPKESANPIRKLIRCHGTYRRETTAGLLAFDYSVLSNGKGIRSGSSGGIVVDSKAQQIVGVLSAITMNRDSVALAVPVQSLADFVTRTQPYLTQSIFPTIKTISPVSGDINTRFQPPPMIDALQHRPEESAEIRCRF